MFDGIPVCAVRYAVCRRIDKYHGIRLSTSDFDILYVSLNISSFYFCDVLRQTIFFLYPSHCHRFTLRHDFEQMADSADELSLDLYLVYNNLSLFIIQLYTQWTLKHHEVMVHCEMWLNSRCTMRSECADAGANNHWKSRLTDSYNSCVNITKVLPASQWPVQLSVNVRHNVELLVECCTLAVTARLCSWCSDRCTVFTVLIPSLTMLSLSVIVPTLFSALTLLVWWQEGYPTCKSVASTIIFKRLLLGPA